MKPTVASVDTADLRRLVDDFYATARRDPLLGPVFHRALGDDDDAWEHHLAHITQFWELVVLGRKGFRGNLPRKHMALGGLRQEQFARWLELFEEAAFRLLPADAADVAMERAHRVAAHLTKLEARRDEPSPTFPISPG